MAKKTSGSVRVRTVTSARSAAAEAKPAKPKFVKQLDYEGRTEQVDTNEYNIEITCIEPGCREHRYIKPQDAFQVKRCKPHTAEYQRAHRAEMRRARRAAAKPVARKVSGAKSTKKPKMVPVEQHA